MSPHTLFGIFVILAGVFTFWGNKSNKKNPYIWVSESSYRRWQIFSIGVTILGAVVVIVSIII